ncbi:unnamed protein product [Dicrocoelium dendriticum]|nr:unnamed protein product [Dicrocoelium dendriticum]
MLSQFVYGVTPGGLGAGLVSEGGGRGLRGGGREVLGVGGTVGGGGAGGGGGGGGLVPHLKSVYLAPNLTGWATPPPFSIETLTRV